MNDIYIMKYALKEAEKAFKKGEVPVGCVIVKNNKIIAKAHNLKESKNNAKAGCSHSPSKQLWGRTAHSQNPHVLSMGM